MTSEWTESVARLPAHRRALGATAMIALVAAVLGGVAVWRIAPRSPSTAATSMPSVPPSEKAIVVSPAPTELVPVATATAPATIATAPAVTSKPAASPATQRDAGAPARRAVPATRPATTMTDEERIFGRH